MEKVSKTPIMALRIACAYVGNQKDMADAIGVTGATISTWFRTGKVGASYVKAISDKTGGEITMHDLRPDIF